MDLFRKKTAHQDPAGSRWAVLRSEEFWAGAAGWSAVIFSAAVGAAAIAIVYWTGSSEYEPPWFMRGRRHKMEAVEAAVPPPPPFARRAVDGLPMAEGEIEGPYAAATIDNMIAARPSAGLARASLVIEAPVEGGITRFLALYPVGSDVEKIGPVRSVRPYYLDWALEYDALFAHVGGSPEALEKIKTVETRDLNQFFNADFFWRAKDRDAPHNVFTSAELLGQATEKRYVSRKTKPTAPWKFKDEAAPAELPAETADIVIDFSVPAYRVTWVFDAENNHYDRYQGGKQHRDEDGTPVRAKNIAVQYTKVTVVDDIGRRHIVTVGTGDALIALDGRTIKGTWSKKDLKSRTRFFDDKGEEIAFNPGSIWVEVVPKTAKVTY